MGNSESFRDRIKDALVSATGWGGTSAAALAVTSPVANPTELATVGALAMAADILSRVRDIHTAFIFERNCKMMFGFALEGETEEKIRSEFERRLLDPKGRQAIFENVPGHEQRDRR